MIHVLVTRSEEDGLVVADALKTRGIGSTCIPFQKVYFFPIISQLEDIQALIFTSKNGVRAYCHAFPQRDIVVYCVGNGTAELAKASGFKRVNSAQGDVVCLVDLLKKDCQSTGKTLLYVSGKTVSHELEDLLPEYPIRRIVGYEMQDHFELTESEIQELTNPNITHVCLFSTKSSERFAKVIKKYKCEETCRGRECVVFSQTVGNQIEHLPWNSIKVLDHPSLDAMLRYFYGIR